MANELRIRCIMNKDSLPVTGAEQAVYALVDIKAGGGKVFGSMPANFGLVLDRSGSMDGEKMNNLKEAVGYVVEHLNDGETLIPSQSAKNREAIRAALANVSPRGGTQISDGLKAGLAEVKKGYSPERVNRVLLLTAGQTWDGE